MEWEKLGRIFEPDGSQSWMASHAALPVALHLDNSLYRVYCAGRNTNGKAQIGFFDFDLNFPQETVRVSEQPVIALGTLGSYEDSGITSSCIVEHEGKLYQYYTGWSLGTTVPFYFNIGVAVSEDGGETFEKVSEGPIMGRDRVDPYLLASPSIMIENGLWRMWYVSGLRWVLHNGEPMHYYHIRYAESHDGLEWYRDGRVCIDFETEEEHAFGRPSVVKDGNLYKMWYSYRGDHYRIGYAESEDGLLWNRKDAIAGITPSLSGWDSDMLEYPDVFNHEGSTYMLYNGNDYGKSGIGLALLTSESESNK